jgi:putative transcriptional regulator
MATTRVLAVLIGVAGLAPALPALAQQARPGESLKGRFLVAAPAMPDPRFQGSVIFMIEHSAAGGAVGVVVNRPATRRPLGQVLAALGLPAPASEDARIREIELFWGGPVESDKAFVLHGDDFKMEGTAAVAPGVALSPPKDALVALGEGRGPARFLLAIGYAGWSPGQLEAELAQNGWAVVTAGADFLFGTDHLGKWERAWRMRTQDL